MTQIKALFFDIDGTLVSFKTHSIPKSAMEAIHEAKSRGVKVFISTGRPLQIMGIVDDVMEIADGCITCNGACCFIGDKTVSQTIIPRQCAEAIVSECKRINKACFVFGTEHIALINYNEEARGVFEDQLGIKQYKGQSDLEKVLEEPILQVTPFFDAQHEAAILPNLQGCIGTRWHRAFIDVVPDSVSKATGLEHIAREMGIGIESTMAFGDGGNDKPIIQRAGIGVAMGNAWDDVKEIADYVTTSVDDDGVANAMRHFNVI